MALITVGSTQFPSDTSTYKDQVVAWVRMQSTAFTTLPALRNVFPTSGSGSDNFVLPLQRYAPANKAAYEDTEPGAAEMILMGIRDAATGDFNKLGAIVNGLGVGVVADLVGGLAGANLKDVSMSDKNFKHTAKRVHTFGWSLYANNEKDAVSLDTIANQLQVKLYPTILMGSSKVLPPPMWKITVVPNGGSSGSKVLSNDIGLCVLTDVTVNRLDRQMGPVLTKSNYYLGLDITATFIEIEPTYASMLGNKLLSRSRAQPSVAGVAAGLGADNIAGL